MKKLLFALVVPYVCLAQSAEALTVTLTSDDRRVSSNTGPIGGFTGTPSSFGADFNYAGGGGTYQTSIVPQPVSSDTYSFSAEGAALGFYGGGICGDFSCDDFSHSSDYRVGFTVDEAAQLDFSGSFDWLSGDVQAGSVSLSVFADGLFLGQTEFDASTQNSLAVSDAYLLSSGVEYRIFLDARGDSGDFDTSFQESLVGYDIDGVITAAVVPIPAAAWLFGSALAGLGWMRRKQTV
jgi:hypothetical protein